MNKDFIHIPVLLKEILKIFDLQKGQRVADLTLGLGGHTEKLCQKVGPDGLVIGIDQDQEAIQITENRLGDFPQIRFKHSNFSNLGKIIYKNKLPKFDAILIDLGISSMQIDNLQRGFSFQSRVPLDMRMDQSQENTAAKIINKSSLTELKNIFKKYGEEREAGIIAQEIIQNRPIKTSKELADLIVKIKPQKGRIHPATKIFQALRIAVNNELRVLEIVLPQAFKALADNGKLAIITFHSLEDRIVKKFFQNLTKKCHCPPDNPICRCPQPPAKNLTTKAIIPSKEEIEKNPRARSAKLRVIIKTDN